MELPGQAAFLQAPASQNDHDLGVFQIGSPERALRAPGAQPSGSITWPGRSTPSTSSTGIAGKLRDAGALVGASDHGTTKALYAHDPDGLEFEVCWLVPADRLPAEVRPMTEPLDLAAEKARYGGSTRGGVGVSFPALV